MRKITLKTLPKATAQQVFDQVATHLLKQGKKSYGRLNDDYEKNGCKYREGELACAAGCLIGKSEYRASFENKTWYGLVSGKFAPVDHYALIEDLQGVHDSSEPNEWENELDRVAVSRGLSFNLAQYKAA